MNRQTLVSTLTVEHPDGVVRERDVPVFVSDRSRGGIVIETGTHRVGYQVALTLTEGERIALIEALGGKDAS